MTTNLKDTANLISKITPQRAGNAAQILSSYYWSRISSKARISGLPISLSIEPTTSCNLRCPECPSGLRSFTRPTGNLTNGVFNDLLDELSPSLIYLLLYFQGEPYLHPGFLDLVEHASKKKRLYTATSTNAHYLTSDIAKATVESGLDRLIISIDGTSQETYESYRVGGKLEKVLEGTRNIIDWKRKLKSATPHVIFQFLVVRPNQHQVEEVYKLAKEIGVDQVGIKTAQIYDYENGSDLMPTIGKYSRYRKVVDGKYEIKNKLLNQCWKMWQGSVITWDGRVVPCCFDKDADHLMGKIGNDSFKSIWTSANYNAFRSSILKSRNEIDICKNCTEGTKVWA